MITLASDDLNFFPLIDFIWVFSVLLQHFLLHNSVLMAQKLSKSILLPDDKT